MKKVVRILVFVLFAMVGLMITGLIYERKLEKKWSNEVIELGDIASVTFGGIELYPLTGAAIIYDIDFPDSLNKAVIGKIDHIRFSGLNWPMVLFQGREALRLSHIKVLDIDAQINLARLKPGTDTLALSDSTMVFFRGHDIDIRFDKKMEPILHEFHLSSLELRPSSGKYGLKISKMTAEEDGETVQLDSVRLIPRYSKDSFAIVAGFRIGRIEALVPEVDVSDIDFKAMIRDSELGIGEVEMINPAISVFTDKRLPIATEKYEPLLHEALLNAGVKIDIEKVDLRSGRFQYFANNPETGNLGEVSFGSVYVSILNCTNVTERIASNSTMTLDLRARVLDRASLRGKFKFPLDQPDYRFEWNGSVSAADMRELNKFIDPVLDLRLRHGKNRSMEFNFVSDSTMSMGDVRLAYAHLRADALDPKTREPLPMASWVANNLIIHPDNIKSSSRFRVGNVEYERERHRGFAHYIWTSLERGIAASLVGNEMFHQLEEGL